MQSRVSLIHTMWADQFVEISKYCQCECLENVKLRPAGGRELMADGNPRAESEHREAASELIITVGSRQVTASQSLMWHLQVLIDVNCKMWYYQGVAVCPAPLTQCVGLSSYLQFTDAGWQWGMSWSCEQVPSPTTLLPPSCPVFVTQIPTDHSPLLCCPRLVFHIPSTIITGTAQLSGHIQNGLAGKRDKQRAAHFKVAAVYCRFNFI